MNNLNKYVFNATAMLLLLLKEHARLFRDLSLRVVYTYVYKEKL